MASRSIDRRLDTGDTAACGPAVGLLVGEGVVVGPEFFFEVEGDGGVVGFEAGGAGLAHGEVEVDDGHEGAVGAEEADGAVEGGGRVLEGKG